MVKERLIGKLLNIEQKILNKAYEKEGLTDEILEYQIRINELRSKYDIPDPDMLNDDGFCQ